MHFQYHYHKHSRDLNCFQERAVHACILHYMRWHRLYIINVTRVQGEECNTFHSSLVCLVCG